MTVRAFLIMYVSVFFYFVIRFCPVLKLFLFLFSFYQSSGNLEEGHLYIFFSSSLLYGLKTVWISNG